MLIDEIFALEAANGSGIHLIRDRKFFVAYERSAFRFVKLFRPYRVHGKFVKKVSAEVVYLGFPDTVLADLQREVEEGGYAWNVIEPDRHFEISGIPEVPGFTAWKNSVLAAVDQAANLADRGQATAKALPKDFVQSPTPKSQNSVPMANLFLAYREAYDFSLYVCRLSGKFARNYRFGLGENLRDQSVELLSHLQLAVSCAADFDPEFFLRQVLKMRIELRLLMDLRQITPRQWIFANGNIEKIISLLRLESGASRSVRESLLESSSPLSPGPLARGEQKTACGISP